MKWALVIVGIFCSGSLFATVVESKNPEYASKKLEFFTYSDPVTLQKESIFVLQFDASGYSKTEIQLSKITFAFCDFGIYRGLVFLEPSKTISLLLPPLREKSFADQKNPFFTPVSFWFDTSNPTDLNKQIMQFENNYNELTDKFMDQLYFQRSKTIFDSVKISIQKRFPKSTSDFFETYKALKMNSLESDVFRLKSEITVEFLKNIKAEYWNQPSFIEFFGKVFTNRLSFDARSIKGKELKAAVNTSNLQLLLNHVNKNYKLNGNIADLALLKMLQDGFYSGDFSKKSISELLKNNYFQNHATQLIQKTAGLIAVKTSFLNIGTKAPAICLNDLEGTKKCTNSTTDKHSYIVFADAEMIICKEQLKYLSTISGKFSKFLEIVVIFKKTELNKIKIFVAENKVPGIKLIDETNVFIDKYRIKTFPTCFLFNEKHEVVFEETKSPLDGFEQQFGSYIQRELFERQRNQK